MKSSNFETSNFSEAIGASPSKEEVLPLIMSLKNNFLRQILSSYLDSTNNQLDILLVAIRSSLLLKKQKKEEKEMAEKIQKGDFTIKEIDEFSKRQVDAIYCLSCIEEIKDDDKVCFCTGCHLIYHQKCFGENENKCKCCQNL